MTNSDEIRLDAEYSDNFLGDIIQRVKESWGEDIDLDRVRIKYENVKMRGCNCCYDPTDYEMHMVIEYLKG